MEKCGKIWKNGRFSGRIWPDWGNTARADMAGLGSIGLNWEHPNSRCNPPCQQVVGSNSVSTASPDKSGYSGYPGYLGYLDTRSLWVTWLPGGKHHTQPAGFEPARAEPNGFQVHRLNHSATTARMRG